MNAPQKSIYECQYISFQLFGPKWSSNTPKYAATLTAAPLQPKKQAPQPSISQSEAVAVNPEKTASKPASTWSDPFTSDGQECKHFYNFYNRQNNHCVINKTQCTLT